MVSVCRRVGRFSGALFLSMACVIFIGVASGEAGKDRRITVQSAPEYRLNIPPLDGNSGVRYEVPVRVRRLLSHEGVIAFRLTVESNSVGESALLLEGRRTWVVEVVHKSERWVARLCWVENDADAHEGSVPVQEFFMPLDGHIARAIKEQMTESMARARFGVSTTMAYDANRVTFQASNEYGALYFAEHYSPQQHSLANAWIDVGRSIAQTIIAHHRNPVQVVEWDKLTNQLVVVSVLNKQSD